MTLTRTAATCPAPADRAPDGVEWPEPHTAVLAARNLRPDAEISALSRFAEDAWDLTPAIFEDCATTVVLDFTSIPDRWRQDAKHYVWQLINFRAAPGLPRVAGNCWPSPLTVRGAFAGLRGFLKWLPAREVSQFAHVTPGMLDRYVIWLGDQETGVDWKHRRAQEVYRLWAYRAVLPPRMRLPAAAPWDGEKLADLLGRAPGTGENRTARIREHTMQALIAWAIRFVEDFSDDIIAAYHEHLVLAGRTRKSYEGGKRTGTRHSPGALRPKAEAYLARLRANGEALPGAVGDDGDINIDWYHVARILDCNTGVRHTSTGRLVRESGLPVRAGALLDTPITGSLDGRPWRGTRIGFLEAPRLARQLSAACLAVIGYLSGARPGEILSLRRGCMEHDETTGLWLMHGRYWKGAKDAQGNKIPEGKIREVPWVVVEVVAHAVHALERLHSHDLLFPARFSDRPARVRRGKGRAEKEAADDLNALVDWVDMYCNQHGRSDPIPPDGRLNISRFRRTLAWFIRRRPRGLVAASLQYGHVETQILQGYAGSYESGFPDDYAFEDWLFRLEILAEDERRLAEGEHVSGPAADSYRQRVQAAVTEFAGMVVTTGERARTLLADPRLQIFHGDGMTCVFNGATAPCQRRTSLGDPAVTPDTDDCRPQCPNLARTDRDIEHVREAVEELQEIVADPLAPPIRHQREQHELERMRAIVHTHENGKGSDTP